jgi:BirA family transcriptional regulator, biotin operon repressor / biotin---[acetyl-CoA-carboxylase] ligase
MAFALGSKAVVHGYRLAAYDTIGSTSTEVRERALQGDPGRLWIVAEEQTAGHGRRGSSWKTPRGNLAASLLMLLPDAPARAATLGFVAGLALEQAIRTSAPEAAFAVHFDGADGKDARLRLKWPNDVLVGGAKVAGILLEAIAVGPGRHAIVIGIGVNVRHAPEGIAYPTTSLDACGSGTSAEALFGALSDAWLEQEAVWSGSHGFAAVRRRWLERAAGLGAPIAVRSGRAVLRGTFETIDEEGRLVVRSADGETRLVSAGEVHFGGAATATA